MENTPVLDVSGLTSALTLDKFAELIEGLLPIVGVAVLVGFLCYIIRWCVGLFRGI